jgi:ketosteroid isomerase-like protein
VSQERVEALRKGNVALRTGDWDALQAFYDPHVVVRTDPRWPERVFYGREAALAWYQGLWESGGGDIRYEEILDLGDRALARARWVFHGQLSGVEGEQHTSVIYTFRDGRIILEEFFIEHGQALKALGLESPVSANLDLVRSIYGDWERGDFSRADWADPEIEYTQDEIGVFPRSTWKGLARMAEGAREQLESWADHRIQAEEYRELDGRRVLVLDRLSGRAKHTGLELGEPLAGARLFVIQGGKVTKLVAYHNRDRALAGLGLAAEGDAE